MLLGLALAGIWYFRRTPAVTERDSILLTDFVNTTGNQAFDGTLNQALAVKLGESPFLNILPGNLVRETLRLMNRSPDEPVTAAVGREICARRGVKAMITGRIASLGSHYVITLGAVNSRTGESLAREQVEVASIEGVLQALGRASSGLRKKLGESIGSIEKFDTPIDQATTSSLEALKSYNLSLDPSKSDLEAIPFLKRAIELDPDFAMAYSSLATRFGKLENAREFFRQAFEAAQRQNLKESAASIMAWEAVTEAGFGNFPRACEKAARAMALAQTRNTVSDGATALALSGDIVRAEALAGDLARPFPKDTLINGIYLPSLRGSIELRRGNPDKAIQWLKAITPHERLYPQSMYILGQAHLQTRAGNEAAMQFQRILDRASWTNSPWHSLAHLGLGRAWALAGDAAKSHQAYNDFSALWKDADPDIPILKEARAEYARLKQRCPADSSSRLSKTARSSENRTPGGHVLPSGRRLPDGAKGQNHSRAKEGRVRPGKFSCAWLGATPRRGCFENRVTVGQ